MSENTEITQCLTFNLSDEVFAVDVGRVREILEITSITKVPQTPDFMRGVINLRGSVVPVIEELRSANNTVATTSSTLEERPSGESLCNASNVCSSSIWLVKVRPGATPTTRKTGANALASKVLAVSSAALLSV